MSIDPRVKRPAFWFKALPMLALVLGVGGYLGQRFHIGIDDQTVRCLGPYRFYLIDRAERTLRRGDVFAFYADPRTAPYFEPGRVIVKQAAGVAGDEVRVDRDGVRVNGAPIAHGLALAAPEKLNKPPETFVRTVVVPEGAYWAAGTHPRSFDSRYWGYVHARQVIGRAYPLF
ncbi:MAG: signal peptidase I [Rhodobacteraceae bacterium]|nr:signal peptidase I [Paracoccaceae bacterium]